MCTKICIKYKKTKRLSIYIYPYKYKKIFVMHKHYVSVFIYYGNDTLYSKYIYEYIIIILYYAYRVNTKYYNFYPHYYNI